MNDVMRDWPVLRQGFAGQTPEASDGGAAADPLADFFYTQDSRKVLVRLNVQGDGRLGLSIGSEDGAHERGLIAEDMVRLGVAIQRAAERVIEGRTGA